MTNTKSPRDFHQPSESVSQLRGISETPRHTDRPTPLRLEEKGLGDEVDATEKGLGDEVVCYEERAGGKQY